MNKYLSSSLAVVAMSLKVSHSDAVVMPFALALIVQDQISNPTFAISGYTFKIRFVDNFNCEKAIKSMHKTLFY